MNSKIMEIINCLPKSLDFSGPIESVPMSMSENYYRVTKAYEVIMTSVFNRFYTNTIPLYDNKTEKRLTLEPISTRYTKLPLSKALIEPTIDEDANVLVEGGLIKINNESELLPDECIQPAQDIHVVLLAWLTENLQHEGPYKTLLLFDDCQDMSCIPIGLFERKEALSVGFYVSKPNYWTVNAETKTIEIPVTTRPLSNDKVNEFKEELHQYRQSMDTLEHDIQRVSHYFFFRMLYGMVPLTMRDKNMNNHYIPKEDQRILMMVDFQDSSKELFLEYWANEICENESVNFQIAKRGVFACSGVTSSPNAKITLGVTNATTLKKYDSGIVKKLGSTMPFKSWIRFHTLTDIECDSDKLEDEELVGDLGDLFKSIEPAYKDTRPLLTLDLGGDFWIEETRCKNCGRKVLVRLPLSQCATGRPNSPYRCPDCKKKEIHI